MAKMYIVVGTAPAFMGKSIAEADIETVLTSFASAKGDSPIPMEELALVMTSKVDYEDISSAERK